MTTIWAAGTESLQKSSASRNLTLAGNLLGCAPYSGLLVSCLASCLICKLRYLAAFLPYLAHYRAV
ncbi:hypothetical protein M422DRAFT_34818, partial [Sphaerobolus stellatus SS14]